MMGNPEVVILDEPFANLDPTTQIRLKNIIKVLTNNEQITVLISSHDLSHVTDVCQRIVVLDKGIVEKDINTSVETLQELEVFIKNDMINIKIDCILRIDTINDLQYYKADGILNFVLKNILKN